MLDSLHIQQESAAQRIRDFAIHFFPNAKWEIDFDKEVYKILMEIWSHIPIISLSDYPHATK